MTVLRLIPLPTHAAIEFAGGLALMVTPFLFGFSAAGLVVVLTFGALVAGLALSAAADDGGRGLSLAAHLALDQGIALALAVGGLALAARGDHAAASALLVGAAVQLLLTLTTRYSARR